MIAIEAKSSAYTAQKTGTDMAIGNMWVTTYEARGAFTLWLVLADGYGALRCIDTADTEEGAYAIIQAIEDGARAANPHFDKKRKQVDMKKKTKIGRAALNQAK